MNRLLVPMMASQITTTGVISEGSYGRRYVDPLTEEVQQLGTYVLRIHCGAYQGI